MAGLAITKAEHLLVLVALVGKLLVFSQKQGVGFGPGFTAALLLACCIDDKKWLVRGSGMGARWMLRKVRTQT